MAKKKGKTTVTARKAAANAEGDEAPKVHWAESDTMQRGLLVIFLFAFAAVSVLSFVDAAGDLGVWVDRVLGWMFGYGRYISPAVFALFGYIFLHPEKYQLSWRHWLSSLALLLTTTALLQLFVPYPDFVAAAKQGQGGGFIGLVLSLPLLRFTSIWVTIIVLLGGWLASVSLLLNRSVLALLLHLPQRGMGANLRSRVQQLATDWSPARRHDDTDNEVEADSLDDSEQTAKEAEFDSSEIPDIDPEYAAADQADLKQQPLAPAKPAAQKKKKMPKIDLPLDLLLRSTGTPTSGNITDNKEKIRRSLENFGIDVEMGEVSVGPRVSQYTLKPSEGVKLTQITTLHNDIALALAAHPIRIEAPIPGKSLVGIEIPNTATATVTVREIMESKEFKKRKDTLALCLGKDVSGKSFIASLSDMPHLLIAGATGSGKSVCINGVITSLLYQNSPDQLRMILVDPKRVELSVYAGVPHLMTPVITDVEKTINALKWTVAEMDRRYELLSRASKRNIDSYNATVGDDEQLPYVVFVIDELADLMSVAAKSVEAAIVRLAQMARAVGIHLVLATQRPSVNVITGLIKANMPARIAFSVASQIDSRTILDFSGAEKLLGKGDMLYLDAGLSKPKRVQGAFVTDEEIERVVDYLKERSTPEYNSDITEPVVNSSVPGFSSSGGDSGDDHDDMVPEAKEVILQAGKASASLLQRRLRVGYARAARILDILEEDGFIGPADGAKPREILVSSSRDDQSVPEEINEFADDGGTGERAAKADERDNQYGI